MKEETFTLLWLMTTSIIPTGKIDILLSLNETYQN